MNTLNEEQQQNHVRCLDDFGDQLAIGQSFGIWLGVVWTPELDGSITTRKTSSNFPPGRYLECLLSLKELLEREIGLHPEAQTPLRIAPQFQQRAAVPDVPDISKYAVHPDSIEDTIDYSEEKVDTERENGDDANN